MAVIAIPVLEAVAVRVLAALGVGLVTGVAGEAALKEARKRKDEADRAKVAPVAKVEATTKERKKCDECPPDKGILTKVSHHMSERSREYQARITGFAPGMEWVFEGRDFDGFKSKLCLLQEAKADYDQFFDKDGDLKYKFQKNLFTSMGMQAAAQASIVDANPPSKLNWYFQTKFACDYMRPGLIALDINVIYEP
jgi:hypothetical protein